MQYVYRQCSVPASGHARDQSMDLYPFTLFMQLSVIIMREYSVLFLCFYVDKLLKEEEVVVSKLLLSIIGISAIVTTYKAFVIISVIVLRW